MGNAKKTALGSSRPSAFPSTPGLSTKTPVPNAVSGGKSSSDRGKSTKVPPKKRRSPFGVMSDGASSALSSALLTAEAAIDSTVGTRALLHHSHRFFLKFIQGLGGDFQVQNWGDEKLGLVTLPLTRKPRKGRKRRVVFIPGLGDSPVSWLPIFLPLRRVLKKEYDELVIVDFPGFGGFLSREKAFDSMDRLLACTMDCLDRLQPETLIGHSLGGWIAGHYASQNPATNRLKKLLLLSPSGVLGDGKSRKEWIERFDRLTREGFGLLRPHVFHREPFWFRVMVRDVAKFLDTPEMVSFLRSIEERHFLTDRLGQIRAKTFLLWGEKDSLIPSAWMKEWLEHLSDDAKVSAVYLTGSGHSPHAERPTVLTLLLGEIFLGKDVLGRVPSPFWRFEHSLRLTTKRAALAGGAA